MGDSLEPLRDTKWMRLPGQQFLAVPLSNAMPPKPAFFREKLFIDRDSHFVHTHTHTSWLSALASLPLFIERAQWNFCGWVLCSTSSPPFPNSLQEEAKMVDRLHREADNQNLIEIVIFWWDLSWEDIDWYPWSWCKRTSEYESVPGLPVGWFLWKRSWI